MISVYLDNCCYNRPYDDQTQLRISLETQAKVYVQRLIANKKLGLVYSYISEFENNKNPHSDRRKNISDFFCNAAVFVDYSFMDEVETAAEEIMSTGVKEMDALHVAAAIIGKADYFLTTDIRLLKYHNDKIQILNPLDFVRILEVQL